MRKSCIIGGICALSLIKITEIHNSSYLGYLPLLCIPEKASLRNGVPSYEISFEEGCHNIQII